MAKEIIPWNVFLEALNQRPRARRGEWLARWRFTDEGAFTRADFAPSAEDLSHGVENTEVPLSAGESERRRTLH